MSKKYLVYLHSIGFTQANLCEIFDDNNDYKSLFEKLSKSTLDKFNIKNDKKKKILDNYSKFSTDLIDKKLSSLGVSIITINDNNYPNLLKEISNPPYFLYVRGKLLNDEYFGVIGSRKITPYAKKAGKEIISGLLNHFTIVSGGANGCDSYAHKVALDNNSRTIVIFGTGIDINYPAINKNMYDYVIEKGGALISIFPLGTPGSLYSFPIRNEIVSGMSRGIFIMQAGEKSGTLITANLALEQGRDVFGIPSGIYDSNFVGSNNLIKFGNAKFIESANDILEEYNYKFINSKREINFNNEEEKIIYNILKNNLSLSIDELIEKTGYNLSILTLNLSMMELSGFISKDNIGNYQVL